jgi:hypothetical protein
LQIAPADQSTSQGEKGLVNVGPLFVAHAQSPELIQPGEGSLHHPAPSPQSAAMFGVALRKKRDDASVTQTLPDRLGVITTVAQYAVRTMAWPASLFLALNRELSRVTSRRAVGCLEISSRVSVVAAGSPRATESSRISLGSLLSESAGAIALIRVCVEIGCRLYLVGRGAATASTRPKPQKV